MPPKHYKNMGGGNSETKENLDQFLTQLLDQFFNTKNPKSWTSFWLYSKYIYIYIWLYLYIYPLQQLSALCSYFLQLKGGKEHAERRQFETSNHEALPNLRCWETRFHTCCLPLRHEIDSRGSKTQATFDHDKRQKSAISGNFSTGFWIFSSELFPFSPVFCVA